MKKPGRFARWSRVLIVLPLLLVRRPLLAGSAPEELAREEPPPSSEAQGISDLESKYAILAKKIRRSPEDPDLKKSGDQAKAKIFDKNFRWGKTLEKKGYLLAAINVYQQALLYNSGSTEARAALHRVKEKLTGLDHKESDQAYQNGMDAYLAGDQKSAEEEFKRALDLNSENEEAQTALEKIDHAKKRAPKPAAMDVSEDSDEGESLWDQSYHQGLQYELLGQYDEAEKQFRTALQARPDDAATKKELAKMEGMVGKTEGQDSQDSYLLAVHSMRAQDYRSAYEYLNDAVQADPTNEQARALLEKLVEQRPELVRMGAPAQKAPSGQ